LGFSIKEFEVLSSTRGITLYGSSSHRTLFQRSSFSFTSRVFFQKRPAFFASKIRKNIVFTLYGGVLSVAFAFLQWLNFIVFCMKTCVVQKLHLVETPTIDSAIACDNLHVTLQSFL